MPTDNFVNGKYSILYDKHYYIGIKTPVYVSF